MIPNESFPSNRQQQQCLLIVSDHTELYQEIANNLKAIALTVHSENTYDQVISQYVRFHYVLTIFVSAAPQNDTTRLIRHLHRLEQTPILVLSQHSSSAEKIAALNAGADSFLTIGEPLDQELLLAHATALIRRYLRANAKPDTSFWFPVWD